MSLVSGILSGMATTDHDLASLKLRLQEDLGRELEAWPGGWQGEIEAALLDAVFSIRARYGGPHSGVRAVVSRWRAPRDCQADDLKVLAEAIQKKSPPSSTITRKPAAV